MSLARSSCRGLASSGRLTSGSYRPYEHTKITGLKITRAREPAATLALLLLVELWELFAQMLDFGSVVGGDVGVVGMESRVVLMIVLGGVKGL
jgi:hypothetical protein